MLAVKMPGGLRSWGRKSGAPGRLWWKKELSMLCASSYGESVRGIRVPQFGFSLKSTQRRSKVVTVMVDWQLFITFNRFIRLLCRGLIRFGKLFDCHKGLAGREILESICIATLF